MNFRFFLVSLAITPAMLVMLCTVAGAAAPECVSPGAVDRVTIIRGECPTFSWGAVAGAAMYELVVFELPDGTDPGAELELSAGHEALYTQVAGTATAWTPDLERGLVPGGSYVWFVRALFDDDGVLEAGDWSQGLHFRLAVAPSVEEVERALEVLRRYAEHGRGDTAHPDGGHSDARGPAALTHQGPAALDTLGVESLPGSAAIKGEMPDPTGETYGVYGVTNSDSDGSFGVVGEATAASGQSYGVGGISGSPTGAGVVAFNAADGPDLLLASGFYSASVTENGLDRNAPSNVVFNVQNSSATGAMTLQVDGVDVITTLTDQDTLGGLSCANGELAKWNGSSWACAPDQDTDPRQPGNQLTLDGNSLDVVEGPGSGLDADALDGLDSTAFSPVSHVHDGRYFTEAELSTSGGGGSVHWDNLGSVPAGFSDNVDDDTTYSAGPGLVLNGTEFRTSAADSTLTPSDNTLSALDDVGTFETRLAMTIGSDGRGLIGYFDNSVARLEVAHCDDLRCTTATVSTISGSGDTDFIHDLVVGSDGLGLMAYQGLPGNDLEVGHCNDVVCSSVSPSIVDPMTDNVSTESSLAIGSDGLGLVAYYDSDYSDENLNVAHCDDVPCSSSTVTALDTAGNVGRFPSLAIGLDGLGLIAYYDESNDDLKVAHCNNVECSSAVITTLDSPGSVGRYPSLTIGSDGLGLISYVDVSNGRLMVIHCDNQECTSSLMGATPLDASGHLINWTSATIGADGLGLIGYVDATARELKIAHCSNVTCSQASLLAVAADAYKVSVAHGVDGLPLIAFYQEGAPFEGFLSVLHCANEFCVPYFRRP